MKTILIILDGASEEKISKLNNKTPIEYANTPILDKIIKQGNYKKVSFCPNNITPDSLSCILTLLGVNEKLIPTGRAYLEALAADIRLEENEVALRCNLIGIKDNKLHSFNGIGLSEAEIKDYSINVKTMKDIKFHHINSYKNILIINKNKINSTFPNIPPHEYIGENISKLLDNFKTNKLLADFVVENKFNENSIEYIFYPWGLSDQVKLPSFKKLHNKECSCICSAEIVKGITKSMEINLPILNNATGDVDTDLKEKAIAVIKELENYDFVISHINGTDEVSHRKDLEGKIKFIEKIDKELLKYIYEENKYKAKIIITADHQTNSQTGKHEKGFVDYVSCNL